MFKILLWLNGLSIIESLKVYKSNLTIHEAKSIPSGLHFLNQAGNVFENPKDFSACIRFNYKVLGITSADTRLITIKNPKIPDNSRLFLKLYARYPSTWFDLGNYQTLNGFSSYVIKDIEK